MERAAGGTPVGVDDPYDHVERCDHLTDDGRCRAAMTRSTGDQGFWSRLAARDYRCPVVEPDGTFQDCAYFRSTTNGQECRRCGLRERRDAFAGDRRPLLEEHHLAYADGDGELNHEITIALCRWCHAKVHQSWARITDDASPDPEAIGAREERVAREQLEGEFTTAAERREE